MPTGILFLIVLLIVVVVHEAGHFFAARSVGMRVKEFAFGFPPRLFGIKRGETTYSFNAIPLGGYVSIDGENGNPDGIPDPKLFGSKSKLAQAWVLFAGPFMNIVLAFVLMSISFMVGYGGANNGLVILSIAKDSPAEISGIKPGDSIYSISNINSVDPVYDLNTDSFKQAITESSGNPVTIEVKRNNEIQKIEVIPEIKDSEYRVGVSLGKLESKKLGFLGAIREGFTITVKMTGEIISGFVKIIASLFNGSDIKASLTGPVGIAKEVGTASSFGFAYLLSFIALISINLGVLNMFPFPALDGGRLLFLLIEKIKGSPIKPNVSGIINLVGFGILIALMVFITIKDIIKLF